MNINCKTGNKIVEAAKFMKSSIEKLELYGKNCENIKPSITY